MGRVRGAGGKVRIVVEHADEFEVLRVDQSSSAGRWRVLGEYDAKANTRLVVRLSNPGSTGALAVDALKFERVR